MKKINFLSLIILLAFATTAQAQFDDLYYDPDTGDDYYYESYEDDYEEDGNYYDEDDYDEYNYWSEYDEYYSSRIRRFHRPYYALGFYNSFGCNNAFRDPWSYNPYNSFGIHGGAYLGSGIYIGYNWGWPSFGFRHSNYWGGHCSPYYRPYNHYYAGSGYPGYYNGGYYGGWHNSGYYGGNQGNHNGYQGGYASNNPKGTHYGSRRSGSTSSSVKGERKTPRLDNSRDVTLNKAGKVTMPANIDSENSARKSVPGNSTITQTSKRLAKTETKAIPGKSREATSTRIERNSRRAPTGFTEVERSRRVSERPSRKAISGQSKSQNTSRKANRSIERPSRSTYKNTESRRPSSTSRTRTFNNNRSSNSSGNFSRSSSRSGSTRSSGGSSKSVSRSSGGSSKSSSRKSGRGK